MVRSKKVVSMLLAAVVAIKKFRFVMLPQPNSRMWNAKVIWQRNQNFWLHLIQRLGELFL